MKKLLTRSTILLLSSLMVFHSIIVAEDEDDVALARIDDLFVRSRRKISNGIGTFRDFERKRELESKVSDLLELDARMGPTKRSIIRRNSDEDTEDDGITSLDPVDTDEEGSEETTVEYPAEDEDGGAEDTTKSSTKPKGKYAGLAHKIAHKLMDRNTKFTISLPVAILAVGSIILLTCCCSLYLRNRLIACLNSLPGRRKHKKSKMLAMDAERGRSKPRSRKRREKSISLSKRRARSMSQDMVNIGTQKSASTTRDADEKSSTTGCYRCCKKKKKREKKTNR